MTAVVVTADGARRLRSGNPWCYRTDVASAPAGLAPGAVVDVVDPRGAPVGQAFWATRSPLALRLLTRRPSAEERVDEAFFLERLERALARRASLAGRDALRLVHGEADLLPGLFVDRYGDALTVQTLSEGADVRKADWARALLALTGARVAVSRDDASGRDFEALPRSTGVLAGDGPTVASYHEGPNRFDIDLLRDAKTGGFLDQVDNHLVAGQLASGGEALDTFSYHGGFALALARGCARVIAVEQDASAAGRLRDNVTRNGLDNVEVREANAFDQLRAFADEGRRFDVVVIDPPGLAKRKEGMKAARRAYHELNLRAFKLVRPDGLLVSCSCSGKVGRELFDDIVQGAAADAKRQYQVLARRGAGIDHPPLGALPETEYLKAWFLRVL